MADVRLRLSCPEYGLSEQVIAVGWDQVMNYKPDEHFYDWRFSAKSEMTISCNALPRFDWDLDEPENPWASFILMDNGCYKFNIMVDVYCGEEWLEIWVGEFSTTEWKINLDEKYVTVNPKPSPDSTPDGEIDCIKRGWNEVLNLFQIEERIEVQPYYNRYMVDIYQQYSDFPCNLTTPDPIENYCFDDVVENTATVPGGPYHLCTFFYHRYEGVGTCDGGTPVPPDHFSDWTLYSGGCPGTPLFWTCPDTGHLPNKFKNGVLFSEVMEFLVDKMGCSIQVQSDFFNINPPGLAPDNIHYQKALIDLQHLVVFQNSDIKRFDSANTSTSPAWLIKLNDLFEDLWKMFKVKPRIEEGILRLEHISFYQSNPGNDYTNEYYIRELQRDNSDTPRITRFFFRDQQCSPYFKGFPIETYCGEGEAETRLSQFNTDLEFCTDSDNAESIGDAGWFLMATDYNGEQYRVSRQNRALSWTELHANYHTYDMAGAGTINGEEAVPESIKKTRKQPEFLVKKCCTDPFNPEEYIITSLGQGRVENADWDISESTLAITPKY